MNRAAVRRFAAQGALRGYVGPERRVRHLDRFSGLAVRAAIGAALLGGFLLGVLVALCGAGSGR